MNRLNDVRSHHPLITTEIRSKKEVDFYLQDISSHNKYLWLSGVTKEGLSVSARLTDFKPYLYVKSDEIKSNTNVESFLNDSIKEHCEYKTRDTIENVEKIERIKFIGFTNRKLDVLYKVYFKSIPDFYKARKCLRLDERIYLSHENTPFENQYLQEYKYKYQKLTRVKIDIFEIPKNYRTSSCLEIISKTEGVTQLEDISVAKVLKAYTRIKCISKEALTSKSKCDFVPKAENKHDSIVSITCGIAWTGEKDMITHIFTRIPLKSCRTDALYKDFNECRYVSKTEVHEFLTESDMILAYVEFIQKWDPDIMAYFPENIDDYEYMIRRIPEGILLGKFKSELSVAKAKNRGGYYYEIKGRAIFDIPRVIQKKVMIQVEQYSLRELCAQKKLNKNDREDVIGYTYSSSQWYIKPNERHMILRQNFQDVKFIHVLTRDTQMFLEYQSISSAVDTGLTKTVCGGEQVRVSNGIQRFVMDMGYYMNVEKLNESPLKFSITEPGREPTYPEPPENETNVRLRETLLKEKDREIEQEKMRYFTPSQMKQKRKNVFTKKQKKIISDPITDALEGIESVTEEEQVKRLSGGSVLHPAPGFWGNNIISVLDFASLYPSLIIWKDICYSNLVFDREYLDLEGVNYIYIQINDRETVCFASMKNAVIPTLLEERLADRKRLKKLMEQAVDAFTRAMYDYAQQSCKILQNAIYGTFGAEDASPLSCKPMMESVTALGRYSQKICTEYMMEHYGAPVIYGDTDSIFVWFNYFDSEFLDKPLEDIASICNEIYKMENFLGENIPFTAENCFLKSEKEVAKEKLKDKPNPKKIYDIRSADKLSKMRYIFFVVADKICEELTDKLFDNPMRMEHENICTSLWIDKVKKAYTYYMFEPYNPCVFSKKKDTGLANKRRNWCHWTRSTLEAIQIHIMEGRISEIETCIKNSIDDLLLDRLDVENFAISIEYKGRYGYKSRNNIQCKLADEITSTTNFETPPCRLKFLIRMGTGEPKTRVVSIDEFKRSNMKLDKLFYLTKQFESPISVQIKYHYKYLDFQAIMKDYKRLASNKILRDLHYNPPIKRMREEEEEEEDDDFGSFIPKTVMKKLSELPSKPKNTKKVRQITKEEREKVERFFDNVEHKKKQLDDALSHRKKQVDNLLHAIDNELDKYTPEQLTEKMPSVKRKIYDLDHSESTGDFIENVTKKMKGIFED